MKRALEVGAGPAARELGLVEQTLSNWVKAAATGKLNAAGAKPITPEQMELSRLRAECARLKMSPCASTASAQSRTRTSVRATVASQREKPPLPCRDPGAGKTKKGYMWAYARGGFDPDPGVVYDFCLGRGGKVRTRRGPTPRLTCSSTSRSSTTGGATTPRWAIARRRSSFWTGSASMGISNQRRHESGPVEGEKQRAPHNPYWDAS